MNSFFDINRLKAQPRKIILVTGEASSDQHASCLVKEIKTLLPEIEIFGMGGTYLRNAGMEIIVDIDTHGSIMGLAEVLGSLKKIIKAYKSLIAEAEKRKPEIAILVDYPDFNLRLAKEFYQKGIKVFYFISPQLWAWRKGRAKIIKKYVTKVIPIFPFEEKFYNALGVNAEFLGHPFIDRPDDGFNKEEFLQKLGIATDKKIIAILPGSRRSEIEKLHRPMLESFQLLRREFKDIEALIPVAPTVKDSWLETEDWLNQGVTYLKGHSREILRSADLGLIASGTATIEATLAELPMIVVYKLNWFSYIIGKLIVTGVKNFAMPNIIAEQEIVKELLQEEVIPQKIAREMAKLLSDNVKYQETVSALKMVKNKLSYHGEEGGTTASRVAKRVLALI